MKIIGNPEYVTVLCNKVYIMHIDNQLEIYFILKKTWLPYARKIMYNCYARFNYIFYITMNEMWVRFDFWQYLLYLSKKAYTWYSYQLYEYFD